MQQEINIDDTIFNISKDKFILSGDKYTYILIASLVYSMVFFCFNKFIKIEAKTPKKRTEVLIRFITTIYAFSTFLIGLNEILYGNSECGLYNTAFQNKIISLSFGFYIAELAHLHYFGILDSARFIHHGLVILGQYECLILESGGFLMIRWALYLDLIGVAFHIRMALLNMGKKDTKIFTLFESLYFGFFLIPRILIIKFSFECWLNGCKSNIYILNLSNILLLVQSYFVFLDIISITKKRINEYNERVTKGINLYWYDVNASVAELSYNKHHHHKHHTVDQIKNEKKKN